MKAISAFSELLNGRFFGVIRWRDLDGLWLRVLASPEGWYASLAGEAAPEVPLSTDILTLHQLDKATYYGYLLLYNLMYMLDDIVILTIGVVTLSQHRLQEKEGRLLKLVAGLVMLGLGIYLLVPR